MSSVIGIDIVAQGDALPSVGPPEDDSVFPEAQFVASDGSLDTTFNPGTGANDQVFAVAVQPDGKILIGGTFTSYNGANISRIARLNADGSLDTTFDVGTGLSSGYIDSIAIRPDGKIVIGGSFTSYDGITRQGVARLNADGDLDTSFGVSEILGVVWGCEIPGIGFFSEDSGYRESWCDGDGGEWVQQPANLAGANGLVSSITLLSNGKVLISGNFTKYDGTSITRIARLNADGSLDTSFTPPSIISRVYSHVLQPDGKVVIVGQFYPYVSRLNADGSSDASFNVGTGALTTVSGVALQEDGKIIIVGFFTSYNGTTRNRIARINTNGSLDTSFNPSTGANSLVREVVIQPDGKILIGGDFTTYRGVSRSNIARVNTDGTNDTSFTPGSGFTGFNTGSRWVSSIVLQPDGKVLVGGRFTSYNGTSRNYIARLAGVAPQPPPSSPLLGESFEVATLDAGDGTGFSGGVSTSGAELFVLTNSSPSKIIRFDQPALTNKGTLSLE